MDGARLQRGSPPHFWNMNKDINIIYIIESSAILEVLYLKVWKNEVMKTNLLWMDQKPKQ